MSDIPIVGYLFKDTSKSKQRTELIIMIQPTVVETDLDQVAVDQAEEQRTILGREAANTPPSKTTTTTRTEYDIQNKEMEPVQMTTRTTTIQAVSAAPDVANGKLPKYSAPAPTSATP